MNVSPSGLPSDRTILVWAALEPGDTTHSQAITLGADHYPQVAVRITGDQSATVAGSVRDRDGQMINGALVSLAGHEEGTVLTQGQGGFVLPAHTQPGGQILLQVAAGRFVTRNLWVTAGDQQVDVVLERGEMPNLK